MSRLFTGRRLKQRVYTAVLVGAQCVAQPAVLLAQFPPLVDLSETTADVTFLGASLGDKTGHAFAHGDFDADGVRDLVILSEGHVAQTGAAFMHILWGGEPLGSMVDLAEFQRPMSVIKASAGDMGILASVTAGDFNKDGFDDICLGIPNEWPFLNADGKAYVIFGRNAFPDTLDLAIDDQGVATVWGVPGSRGRLGSVMAARDINGDDVEDLIISAPTFDPGGVVYVILGRDSFPEQIELNTFHIGIKRIIEPDWYEASGSSLATGDMNNDGVDDLLIGSPGSSPLDPTPGKATLVFGGELPATIDLSDGSLGMKRIYGEREGGSLGANVAIGDFDGDRFNDLILLGGAPDLFGCEECGEIYVVYGNQALPDSFAVGTTELTITRLLGGGTRQHHGVDMRCGDVSGDGYDDIIVTNEPDGRDQSDVGQVTVVYGSQDRPDSVFLLTDTSVSRFRAENRQDAFGQGLSLSDIDNNGVADLLIAARYASPFGRDSAGKVYLFYGARVAVSAHLDVKPGSCPNPLDASKEPPDAISMKGGVLTAAVLGSETLDVTDVDISSLRLGDVTPLRYDFHDVAAPTDNGEVCACPTAARDGYEDLILQFRKSEVADSIAPLHNGDVVELTLTGLLNDGTPIRGADCVTIVGLPADPPSLGDLGGVVLRKPVPNPFNPTTRISYSLPTEGLVVLSIYDVAGRLVENLVDQVQPAGEHVVTWDATAMSSGIYFCRIRVGDFAETHKLVLLK